MLLSPPEPNLIFMLVDSYHGKASLLTERASIKGEFGDIGEAQPNRGEATVLGAGDNMSLVDGLDTTLLGDLVKPGRPFGVSGVSPLSTPSTSTVSFCRFETFSTYLRMSMSTEAASEEKLASKPCRSTCWRGSKRTEVENTMLGSATNVCGRVPEGELVWNGR